MKLVKQLQIAKSMGFKFWSIRGCNRKRVVLIYTLGDTHCFAELSKADTKAKLIDKLNAVIERAQRSHEDMLERAESRRALRLRKSMRVISGGMRWVPEGLKAGEPRGKLSLIKTAA